MKYSINRCCGVPAPGTPPRIGSERAFAVLMRSGMLRIVCSGCVTMTNGKFDRLADDREVVDRMIGQRLVGRGGDGVAAGNPSAADSRRAWRAPSAPPRACRPRRASARPRSAGRACATGPRRSRRALTSTPPPAVRPWIMEMLRSGQAANARSGRSAAAADKSGQHGAARECGHDGHDVPPCV